MSEARIPVDLCNPGQVFACLGFLEAADVLLGDAAGGFDWGDDRNVTFVLHGKGALNPIETVLEFLTAAEPERWAPLGYIEPRAKQGASGDADEDPEADEGTDEPAAEAVGAEIDRRPMFPARQGDRMALPIRIGGGNWPIIDLDHWADGSSRDSFKLYAGNRSADRIARAMLKGVRKKPTGQQRADGQAGDLKTKGVMQLWQENRTALIQAPFDVLTPMGGSFNFDPRGAWTAIDAGYSPNEHKHAIQASPMYGSAGTPPGAWACRQYWPGRRSAALSRRFHYGDFALNSICPARTKSLRLLRRNLTHDNEHPRNDQFLGG